MGCTECSSGDICIVILVWVVGRAAGFSIIVIGWEVALADSFVSIVWVEDIAACFVIVWAVGRTAGFFPLLSLAGWWIWLTALASSSG